LAAVAVTSWPVYSGADPVTLNLVREENEDLDDTVGNAIEMAIISKAKRFIKSTSCQKVINAIWSGKCVYQADSSHSILSDVRHLLSQRVLVFLRLSGFTFPIDL